MIKVKAGPDNIGILINIVMLCSWYLFAWCDFHCSCFHHLENFENIFSENVCMFLFRFMFVKLRKPCL